jgi:two-component system LytT family sensor kinase
MMEKDSPARRWCLRVAFFVGLLTVLMLLDGASTYVAQLRYDKPVTWALAFRRAFKEWASFGLLAAGALWLCSRVRLETVGFRRWLAIHLAASLVFAPAEVALCSWFEAGEVSVQTGAILTFSYLFGKLFVHYALFELILYWVIVMGHLGWSSYQRHREHELEEAELWQQLVEARLDALRMQLNPHFLFNTLHTISALIHDNPEAADRVVARLSELLRLNLDQSKAQELPLHEELAFLDLYLEIEQARFADRLQVERQIEPGLQDALVPCLILQPLAENAIRHGIEQREETGHLTIGARRRNALLELSVRDNGSGLAADNAPMREGIGLSNTRSRLRHLYGDKQKLELKAVPAGGLEVRITIPYHTRAGAD